MRIPSSRVSISAALLTLIAAPGAQAQEATDNPGDLPPPATAPADSPVKITSVAPWHCGGEWSAEIGPAGEGALIALLGTDEEFTSELRQDGGLEAVTSNCALDISADVAPGTQYALTKVSYEGRASLEEGVYGEQTVSYDFVNAPRSSRGARAPHATTRLDGPYEGTVSMDVEFPEDTLVWSSCTQPEKLLQVGVTLHLRNEDLAHRGMLSMALGAGIQMVVLTFATRACPAAS